MIAISCVVCDPMPSGSRRARDYLKTPEFVIEDHMKAVQGSSEQELSPLMGALRRHALGIVRICGSAIARMLVSWPRRPKFTFGRLATRYAGVVVGQHCASVVSATARGAFVARWRLLVLLLSGSLPAQDAASASRACQWSAPTAIPEVLPGQTLRWPSLAVRGTEVYLAGNLAPVNYDAPLPSRTLFLLRMGGKVLPPPRGEFVFLYPKLAFDAAGAVHLFWGEPSVRPASFARWPLNATALWHSKYERLAGWSEPEALLRGSNIAWGPDVGQPAEDFGGGIQLIVSVTDSSRLASLVHIHQSRQGWRIRDLSVGAAYSSITSWHRDSSLIAAVGAPFRGRSAHNELYTLRSTDGGITWSAPERIEGEAATSAFRPTLLSGPSGTVLAWTHERRVSQGAEDLVVGRSADRGRTWSVASVGMTPGAIVLSSSYVLEAAGQVLGAVAVFGSRLQLIEVRDRQGLTLHPLFSDLELAASAAITRVDHRALLVFTYAKRDTVPALGYVTRAECASEDGRD